MSRFAVRRALLAFLLGTFLCSVTGARAESRLVLVVGAKSPVLELNSAEVHRLFLGLTVIVDNRRLHAVRNDSDDLMRRIFFQNIVSMSEPAYDRRMLSLTLQQGRTAPPVVTNTAALLEELAGDPSAVSFAWADDIARDPRVRALRVLWRQ